MNERLKTLREALNISQEALGNKINVTRSHISSIEKGKRTLTDRIISDICREFNVNEEWLRNGTEPMFVEPDTFSLDEYVKSKDATELELLLIKSFFEIPKNIRSTFLNYFRHTITDNITQNEYVSTVLDEIAQYTNEQEREDITEDIKRTLFNQMYIDKELEKYKQELKAEQKGEISSVSEKPKGA